MIARTAWDLVISPALEGDHLSKYLDKITDVMGDAISLEFNPRGECLITLPNGTDEVQANDFAERLNQIQDSESQKPALHAELSIGTFRGLAIK